MVTGENAHGSTRQTPGLICVECGHWSQGPSGWGSGRNRQYVAQQCRTCGAVDRFGLHETAGVEHVVKVYAVPRQQTKALLAHALIWVAPTRVLEKPLEQSAPIGLYMFNPNNL
jgi:Zn ribbon nucleic-acid-binding protein